MDSMSVWSRVVGLGVVALMVGACGPVHPGAAAIVDGERISMAVADETAQTYCIVNLAGQPEGTMYDNAEVRRQALTSLIAMTAADQLAEEKDLKVTVPTDNSGQLEEFVEMIDPQHVEAFTEVFEDNNRLGAIALELGRSDASKGASDEEISQAGFQVIIAAMQKKDIEIDPRFALGQDGSPIADSGSLSVSTMDLDAPAPDERAVALQCS